MSDHNHVKHFLHASVVINSATFLPASFIFLIFSMGALVLQGAWHLFLWALGIFVFEVILTAVLGMTAE